MNTRQAKKIVKSQTIECRIQFNGAATIRTGGRNSYAEGQYRKAIGIHLRDLDREAAERTPGAIERCANLNRKMNAERVAYLIACSADWSPIADVAEAAR